jgi:hypothetical protein
MIYHEFRFISYIDKSFSIEKKMKNTKRYIPITIQNFPTPKLGNQNLDFETFLENFTMQLLNFPLHMDVKHCDVVAKSVYFSLRPQEAYHELLDAFLNYNESGKGEDAVRALK